jgi:Rrf2 family cysteine metabolism transcriptional repressor
MKLSTKTRYGTRALLELALRGDEERVLLKDIAQRQEISLSYLEHIISPLISGGIIRTTKGPRGGISLARDPADIQLSEVIRLLEGSLSPVDCVNDPGACARSGACAARDVWTRLKDAMDDVLEATTLQDMVEKQRQQEQPQTAMYHI